VASEKNRVVMPRYKLRTLLIALAIGLPVAVGVTLGCCAIAVLLRERLAYSYDGLEFYETTSNSCTYGYASGQRLEKIFASIDGGPAKRLSDFTWDDFGPRDKLIIEGDANQGVVNCNGAMFGFYNGKPSFVRLGESPRIKFGAAASGPFLSFPASPKQIKAVFGKPKKTRPTV
jgi:hypothetical protein